MVIARLDDLKLTYPDVVEVDKGLRDEPVARWQPLCQLNSKLHARKQAVTTRDLAC